MICMGAMVVCIGVFFDFLAWKECLSGLLHKLWIVLNGYRKLGIQLAFANASLWRRDVTARLRR
jgi:hypothetical protein